MSSCTDVVLGLLAAAVLLGLFSLILWLGKITLQSADAEKNPRPRVAPTNFYIIGSSEITSDLRGCITPIRTAVTGTQPITFAISPALPDGLMLDSTTGSIQGRPQIPLTPTVFTLTARNTAGHATVSFPLAVRDVIPDFGYPAVMQGKRELQIGETYAFTPAVISQSGEAPSRTTWTVCPPFPTDLGLSLDSVTGKISGKALGTADDQVYVVRVTNAMGDFQDIDIKLSAIEEVPAGPSAVSYFNGAPTYPIETIISANFLQYTGNADRFWLVSGTLPAGLYLETSTGDLVGTTSAVPSGPTSLTIGISFLGGSEVTTMLVVTVENVVPVFAMDIAGVYTVEVGAPAPLSVRAILSKGVDVRFTATNLPPGLNVDPLTGEITGNPTGPAGARDPAVIITGTNAKGQSDVRMDCVVLDNRLYNVAVAEYVAKDVPKFATLLNELALDEVNTRIFELKLRTGDIVRKLEAGLASPVGAVLLSDSDKGVASGLTEAINRDPRIVPYGTVMLSTSFCAPSFQYRPINVRISSEFVASVVQNPDKGAATYYKFAPGEETAPGVTLAPDTGKVSVRSAVALDREFKIIGYNAGGSCMAALQVVVSEEDR
jgi:hypothetical protein